MDGSLSNSSRIDLDSEIFLSIKSVGALVERTNHHTMLIPLITKDTEIVRKAYAKTLTKLPWHLARSLTYDQGNEMSQHKDFIISTGMNVYFVHPASPLERGTNENTNGLIRKYFPKGTAFDEVMPQSIKLAQDHLNGRPRRVLGYRTPNEAFSALVALDAWDCLSNVREFTKSTNLLRYIKVLY